MNIIVSDHAYVRAKDRCGLQKKSIDRMAKKAYESGTDCMNLKGIAANWINNHKESHTAKHIYVYGDKAWIYADNNTHNTMILVTILNIPMDIAGKIKTQIA